MSKDVKRIVVITYSLFLSTFAFGQEIPKPDTQSIIISIGEHYELSLDQMVKFTVGNKNVLGSKITKNSEKLLLKGKSLGHSEIIIWQKIGKKSYHVYVISKQKHLIYVELAKQFSDLGLIAQISSTGVKISGTIEAIEQYQQIIQLITQNRDSIEVNFEMSIDLVKELIAKIYLEFYAKNIYEISCSQERAYLNCTLPNNLTLEKNFQEQLLKKYLINLDYTNQTRGHNFKVKLTIISIEQSKGNLVDIGLSQLNSTISEILKHKAESLIEGNRILLENSTLTLTTVAKPETVVAANLKSSLKIGSEIAIHKKNENDEVIEWKFAGLNLDFEVKPEGDLMLFDYKLSLTSSTQDGNIEGNQKSSSIYLAASKETLLFNIGLTANRLHNRSIIEILNPFGSNENSNSMIHLVGVITIEPNILEF